MKPMQVVNCCLGIEFPMTKLERSNNMAIFVFCVNLLVAGFALVFAVEISTLVIGSLGVAVEAWKRRTDNA